MNHTLLGLVLIVVASQPPTYEYKYASAAVEHDIKRFPGRHVTDANLAQAEAHIHWLQSWIVTDQSDELYEWLQEARHLRDCWWRLKIAWLAPTRECDMEWLKYEIGEDAYAKALMPPCVPIWRFAR